MEIYPYGLVAVLKEDVDNANNRDDLTVIHAVGYTAPPGFETYVALYRELQAEWLIDGEEFYLIPATDDMLEDVINNPEYRRTEHGGEEDFI